MADKETEAEWARMRRVEQERKKAAEAVRKEQEKQGKVNLAFLPVSTKTKGWSSNPSVILADAEKMANRSLILALSGILLIIIGDMGGVVSSTFNLGMAGVILAIPGGLGYLCVAAGMLIATVVAGYGIYAKIKKGQKLESAFWTVLWTFAAVVIYISLKKMIL
jgi:hypothetical protein